MDWLSLLATIVFIVVSWTCLSIILNYNAARKIGFPIIISPVSTLNPLWILTYRTCPKILLLRHLPLGLGRWARCTYMGWSFDDKHALHDELGPIFTIVTPAGNEVTVADAQITHTIFARRKEYIKPAVMYEQLNIFGRNLNTVEGKDWERQRRLTAPSFNEKTSSMVWDEAVRQSQDMIESWVEQGANGTLETVSDTATLALHVLTKVGFGLAYPFHGGVRRIPPGHVMTYRDALSLCLRNIITFAIFPKSVLSSPLLPRKLRELGIAAREFQKYMEELLSHERGMSDERAAGPSNLMSALVRASDNSETLPRLDGGASLSLTDDEIFGNIFAFNLAGHETTANTVASALVLLAANPDCQTWLMEEIDQVFSGGKPTYEEAFPKLQRCLAVMYETLRLYGSIVFIPKSTAFHRQILTTGNGSHVLPSGTAVNINVQALHTDPAIWGADSLQWRPSRWLQESQTPLGSVGSSTWRHKEHPVEPKLGTYVPWADGPRACVGRKFSQVEFVGVIAFLLKDHGVRPALAPEQTDADGKKALQRMVDQSAIFAITLQMTKPRAVGLVWEKR